MDSMDGSALGLECRVCSAKFHGVLSPDGGACDILFSKEISKRAVGVCSNSDFHDRCPREVFRLSVLDLPKDRQVPILAPDNEVAQ